MGKFAASIERPESESVSASGGFASLTSSAPGPRWGFCPQTTVIEASQSYLGASNSLAPDVMDMRIQSVHTGYTSKQKLCIRSWKLKGENLAKFRSEVQEKMNNQKVTWDTLKYSIVEAAKSVCGVTRGQKRKERDNWWWPEDVQRAVKNKKESFKNWQKMRHDTSLKVVFKLACKETESVVAKSKQEAKKHIYDELDTKKGQVKIYKIAKAQQRFRQDNMAINSEDFVIIKDRDGTILTR